MRPLAALLLALACTSCQAYTDFINSLPPGSWDDKPAYCRYGTPGYGCWVEPWPVPDAEQDEGE